MRKTEKRQNQGITLIAVVITIIVLLILAGVSISMLSGNNGVLQKATEAKQANIQASVNEKIKLAQAEAAMSSYGSEKTMSVEKITNLKQKANPGESLFNFTTENPYNNNVTKVVDEVPIPKGYAYVEGTTKEEGLIVVDGNGNEYVWVPVEDATDMYTSGNATLTGTSIQIDKYSKSGILPEKTRTKPNLVGYREPDLLSEYDTDSQYYKDILGFENVDAMGQAFVDDYNEMIKSVEKYKGFYIGRYELTANGEKAGKVLTNTNWYNLYKACKNLAGENINIETRMIYGCQWDMTCKWLEKHNYDINNSSSWGNYYGTEVKSSDGTEIIKASNSKTKLETGKTTFTKANNIYDLAGNCWEWTQEASDTIFRAFRGSVYVLTGSDYPASVRYGYDPTSSCSGNISSRATLYIK